MVDEYLKSIYYKPNHPASFSGITKLYQFVKTDSPRKISKKQIKDFLEKQEVYLDHRPVKYKFQRRHVISPGIGYQQDADLASMQAYSKSNNYLYFLLVIDVFSRFIHTKPLKNKKPNEVIKAFELIYKDINTPKNLRTDGGAEFTAKISREFYTRKKINYFVARNSVKANYAERGIKSIRFRLVKAMQARNSYKWVDLLSSVTEAYNGSYHRSIDMAPVDVNENNEVAVWVHLNEMKTEPPQTVKNQTQADVKINQKKKNQSKSATGQPSYKYKLGDAVKLSFTRYVFQREYSQRFTTEIFYISQRFIKQNIDIYKVKDYLNEEIIGTFYRDQLLKVEVSDDTEYKISKILKTSTRKGKKYHYVSWEGYSAKMNSWILASDLTENVSQLNTN